MCGFKLHVAIYCTRFEVFFFTLLSRAKGWSTWVAQKKKREHKSSNGQGTKHRSVLALNSASRAVKIIALQIFYIQVQLPEAVWQDLWCRQHADISTKHTSHGSVTLRVYKVWNIRWHEKRNRNRYRNKRYESVWSQLDATAHIFRLILFRTDYLPTYLLNYLINYLLT